MMKRKHASVSKPDSSVISAALAAMEAEDLRDLIRDIIPWLSEQTHARLANMLIERAARRTSARTPAAPSDEGVSNIMAFAKAAKRIGYADPSEVDGYLQQGSNAFLAGDYHATSQIFRALLLPLSNVDIDLGQHEMLDEVLGIDLDDCAVQYVVATYMTAVPSCRARSVRTAINDMLDIGHFWEPLREMERIAIEPLPGFQEFLPQWRALVEKDADSKCRNEWGSDESRWLREVVHRIEGTKGLAKIARSTKTADDLQAWCRALVEAGDWKAALSAHEEAAEIVSDKRYWRGDFLDGAALAAQELGRKDLPRRLERAWREAPSMLRLRRWLGSSSSKPVLRKRAAAAMKTCPKKAYSQRALLHIVCGDMKPAAKLLAKAPGLGWSNGEHPGHLLFPLFCKLLGGTTPHSAEDAGAFSVAGDTDIDTIASMSTGPDEQRLTTPEIDELIETAGIGSTMNVTERAAALKAMRNAAEKRIIGVTDNKRRRYYGHAASLAGACVAIDPTPETAAWMAAIREKYRRYSALQRELVRHAD